MAKRQTIPCALTIAGSDSGGGAGIQADLKTFASLGVHGTSVITCVTAQNPARVLGVEACTPASVLNQLEAVFAELRPAVVKTGMLYSRSIIRTVAEFLAGRRLPLVVDPVMVATSGARLLKPSAVRDLRARLLPLATLITPNCDEAAILVGRKLASLDALREAARTLVKEFGCAALVKGGHLRGQDEAVDVFFDGRKELLLSAPFVRNVHTHGTGCTYSAAVAASLARGDSLRRAVRQGKDYITRAIVHRHAVAGHSVLNWISRRGHRA